MHFDILSLCNANNLLQNKILHSRLEALHIQLAEKDRYSVGVSSGTATTNTLGDAGLQNVINYLRRSKEIVSFFCNATAFPTSPTDT